MTKARTELALCALLALAAVAHLAGTFAGYAVGTDVFVWSLSGTAFVFAIVFLHVLRIQRPGDRPVRIAAIAFSLVWVVLALMFGAAQGNILDPRGVTHAVLSLALVGTSLHRPS